MIERPVIRLLGNAVDPALRGEGFSRRGLTWNRRLADVTQVVDIQVANCSGSEGIRFTMNLGVFIGKVYVVCWERPEPTFVRETDCIARWRIGDVLDGRFDGKAKDVWWEWDPPFEVGRVQELALGPLVAKALPHLMRIDSLPTVHEFMKRRSGWEADSPLSLVYRAIIVADSGDRLAAKDLLFNVIVTSDSGWNARARSVASHLAIQLTD